MTFCERRNFDGSAADRVVLNFFAMALVVVSRTALVTIVMRRYCVAAFEMAREASHSLRGHRRFGAGVDVFVSIAAEDIDVPEGLRAL